MVREQAPPAAPADGEAVVYPSPLSELVHKDVTRGVTATEKLILFSYAYFADADGILVWIGQAAIARTVVCSERMVRKALAKFEAAGVMMPVGKDGRGKRYKINIERALELYSDAEGEYPGRPPAHG